jgi:hypothetical protein
VGILRRDVAPVASAYALILMLFAWYRRSRRRTPHPHRPPRIPGTAPRTARSPGFGVLVRHLAATVLGGYAVFLAIVVVFYFVLGGESRTFIDQALREGSILAFLMAFPALLLLGRIEMGRSGRAKARPEARPPAR